MNQLPLPDFFLDLRRRIPINIRQTQGGSAMRSDDIGADNICGLPVTSFDEYIGQ